MPGLSVIIAAYNEAGRIQEQLLAIQTQNVRPSEIVLVDDGSTDRTLDIMSEFARAVPDIQTSVISLPTNGGCARATNRGVAESSGDFLYIASANDVLRPGALAAVADAIRAYPDADLIAGDVAGIHLGWHADHVGAPASIAPGTVAGLFGHRGIIHAAGAVISRKAWDRHGGWAPEWWPYSETLTWHTTACRYGLVYTPHEIAWVRPHDGSASTSVLDREYRRPLMEQAARFVDGLEEPARSRLIGSDLWSIREYAPDMVPMLREIRVARAMEAV